VICRDAPGIVVAAVLWLTVWAPPAEGQGTFLDAVRDLAASNFHLPTANAPRPTPNSQRPTPHVQAALARLKAALEEWDRGITALESRVARGLRGADRERAFQLHVELGLAYRQRGRLDQALRQFDSAAALQPGASDVHLLRALTHEAAGNHAEAGRAFRMAWSRNADNPVKAYLALTRTSTLETAERDRARSVLRQALQRTLSNGSRSKQAPFLVLDALPDTLSPAPVVGDAALAGLFEALADGRLEDAVAAADQASARSAPAARESPLAAFERARTYEAQGQLTEARQAYAAALDGTLAGRHVLYVGIGRLAQVDGDLNAAIESFRHAVRLNPNNPLAHRELAAAYAAAGRSDEAFAELVAALLIDPGDADSMAAVGQLLLDDDQASEAVAVLRSALAVSPTRLETHYALAVALSRAGRTEEAARQFDRFERLSREALELRRREVTGQAGPDIPGR
jgi:tetratricopeptide (TPR) repeat protein